MRDFAEGNVAEQRPALEVHVQTTGDVPADAVAYAQKKIGALARLGSEPILYARVRLTRAADPAISRPAMVQANLDLNGRPWRAHVAAETIYEAIDLVQDRLADRRRRLVRHREERRGDPALGVRVRP